MTSVGDGYGLWSLVAINSLVFIIFAFSFFKPARETDKHDHSAGHRHDAHAHHHEGQDEHVRTGDTLRDPVCGLTVADGSRFRREHNGKWYAFCSQACLTKFQAAPSKYVDPSTIEQPRAVPEGTIYTCPMHPEIRQDHPGQCPNAA